MFAARAAANTAWYSRFSRSISSLSAILCSGSGAASNSRSTARHRSRISAALTRYGTTEPLPNVADGEPLGTRSLYGRRLGFRVLVGRDPRPVGGALIAIGIGWIALTGYLNVVAGPPEVAAG